MLKTYKKDLIPYIDDTDVERLISGLFRRYCIPLSLIKFCKASLIPNGASNVMVVIKFPQDSAYGNLRDYKKFYYEKEGNNSHSIKHPLFENELLFNGDLTYDGIQIGHTNKYSFICNKEVVLSKRLPLQTSLIVLVKNGAYAERYSYIALNRKGSHVIIGILTRLSPNDKIFDQITPLTCKIKILKPITFVNYLRLGAVYNCPYQSECYNYLESQGFDFQYFDKGGNRCYCRACFPNNWINSQVVANERYIIPRGWCRFGLKVPFMFSQINNIWDSWCNVFHGTTPSAGKSIIEHKTLLLHGDILKNGNRLGKKCSAEEWGYYYTSPHICYASHPWYSNIVKLPSHGENKYAQIVLAIKIRHNSYSKQNETEGGVKKIFDDYTVIPENEIEWFSKRRGCTIPYGVLVRIFGDSEKREIKRLAYY